MVQDLGGGKISLRKILIDLNRCLLMAHHGIFNEISSILLLFKNQKIRPIYILTDSKNSLIITHLPIFI